ncbi:hypothetical protein [Levilactobacillus bambusae]|uniref:Uncharacterized protein n=1 Tax=Levilactobacillus bambusae TaxID=2024736 RepID=A0A2V1MXM3_9LACO|nr:hypothetical protein [Levilactobacillus bambusae]PWF99800.1 hypothetical protein DCM90_06995 [Levilactobacillus bambusae]
MKNSRIFKLIGTLIALILIWGYGDGTVGYFSSAMYVGGIFWLITGLLVLSCLLILFELGLLWLPNDRSISNWSNWVAILTVITVTVTYLAGYTLWVPLALAILFNIMLVSVKN